MTNETFVDVQRIRGLVVGKRAIEPQTPVREVQASLRNGSPLDCVVVIEKERPVGLVMRCHLDRVLSSEFGRALYLQRPVREIMDAEPLIVDANALLEDVTHRAMARPETRLYDDLIVTEQERLLGAVSVQVLLTSLAKAQGVLELAGGTAHELSQPLQVILGYAELLAEKAVETGYARDVEVVRRSVLRMAEITQRLQSLTVSYRTAPYLADGQAIVDLSGPP